MQEFLFALTLSALPIISNFMGAVCSVHVAFLRRANLINITLCNIV